MILKIYLHWNLYLKLFGFVEKNCKQMNMVSIWCQVFHEQRDKSGIFIFALYTLYIEENLLELS